MPRAEVSSHARTLGPSLVVGAAALAYGAHLWVVSWSVLATEVILPLLGAIHLALYFWGWGALLVRLPALRRDASTPEPLVVLALGMGAGSIVVLGLGALGLLRLSVFGPLSAVLVLLGLWLAPPWRIARPAGTSFRILDVPLLAAVGAWAFLVLALAFVPDATYDSVAYHLATMKLYVLHEGIVALPWLFHSNMPMGIDLVYLHGLLLGSDQIPVLLALLFGLLAIAATWRLARGFLSPTHSLLAVLLFAVSPEVAESINTCQVELGWTTFAVLSFVSVLEWRRGGGAIDRWLHLSAIFAGFAGGSKFPGLAAGAAVGAIVLLSRPAGVGPRFGPIVRFAWIFLLAASPCYVKTWIHTGTPVWPMSFGIFEVRDWNDDIHRRFLENVGDWKPLSISSPVSFAAGVASVAWQAGGWPLWFFLLFLGASALAWRRAREIWPLLLFASAHFLVWCFVTQQSRFVLAGLPAMVVGLIRLVRPAIEPERASPRAPERIAFACLGAALLLAAAPSWNRRLGFYLGRAMPLLRGASSREEVLAREELYTASKKINEVVPPGSRILLLGENRGYWLDRDYMWGDAECQAVIDFESLRSASAFRARLDELGITHALVGRGWEAGELRVTAALSDVLVTTSRIPIERSYQLHDLGRVATEDRPMILASSSERGCFPRAVMDAREEPGFREGWMSRRNPTPELPDELQVLYPRSFRIRRIRLVSHPDPRLALKSFVIQCDRDGTWTEIPETRTQAAEDAGAWTFDFPPLETRRLRLLVFESRGGPSRLLEVTVE